MHEIQTQIDIKAPASVVWAILTDFSAYKRWNPFIRTVNGAPQIGKPIEVTVQPKGDSPITTWPTLVHLREPRELRWRGGWKVTGLYAEEHRFAIESIDNGNVRFHHTQRAKGMAVPFLRGRLLRTKVPAFHAMNAALKARAERAQAKLATLGGKAA